MKKGEENRKTSEQNEEGIVEKIVYSGDALIRSHQPDGRSLVTFVPGALPNEKIEYAVVEKKRHYTRGRLLEVLQASPERVLPKCCHFGRCGGCQLQHLRIGVHKDIKKRWLSDAIDHITSGSFSNSILWNSPEEAEFWHWRKKITLHGFCKNGYWDIGYYTLPHLDRRSSSLFSLQECPLFFTESEKYILEDVRSMIHLLFDGFSSELQVDFSFVRLDSLSSPGKFSLHISCIGKKWNKQEENCRIGLFKKEMKRYRWARHISSHFFGKRKQLLGSGLDLVSVGKRSLMVPLHIFSQNHPTMSKLLWHNIASLIYKKISLLCKKAITFLDLYAGIGVVSMLLDEMISENEKRTQFQQLRYIHSVEMSHPACKVFESVMEQFTGIRSYVYPKSVEEALLSPQSELIDRLRQEDSEIIWSVNPPRDGLSLEVRKALIRGSFGGFGIYTSCHLATLQRDLCDFLANGWVIQDVQGYDFFPMTTHFESIVLLVKENIQKN